ncbi:hypothetical protein BX600DRAFT_152708 [Xylariales sp. PMI_506]|nr:hypothetical protein BX600DRAFT_152708 [Xylariales sp. PMI_506]
MRFPPAAVIATWPSPNFVNPENRGPTLMIVELIMLGLALLCTSLRLYVRIVMIKKSWWDDWLMVVAAIFCCGVTVSVILATELYGWNIHVWDMTPKQMTQGRQVSIAGQTIFVFASGLSKLSILVSYLRIAVRKTTFWWATWATIVVVIAAMPGFLALLWLQCIPAASYWNLTTTARDCIPELPPLMGQTVVTLITDAAVYVLPMPTLWQLKLARTQRLGLSILFGLGAVVVAAGCMRAYWTHYVEAETYDVTWDGFSLWIWAAVEVNLGVICGSAPVLKPLLFPSRSLNVTRYYGNSGGLTFGSSAHHHWGGPGGGVGGGGVRGSGLGSRKKSTLGSSSGMGTSEDDEDDMVERVYINLNSLEGSSQEAFSGYSAKSLYSGNSSSGSGSMRSPILSVSGGVIPGLIRSSSPSPTTTTTTAIINDTILEEGRSSDETLRLPRELPPIPRAVFKGANGRYSGFFKATPAPSRVPSRMPSRAPSPTMSVDTHSGRMYRKWQSWIDDNKSTESIPKEELMQV